MESLSSALVGPDSRFSYKTVGAAPHSVSFFQKS